MLNLEGNLDQEQAIYNIIKVFPQLLLIGNKGEKIETISWGNQCLDGLINVADEYTSRCDTLRSSQYHLYSTPVGNAQPESNQEEISGKTKK